MKFEEPRGCRLTAMHLEAADDDAFEAGKELLGLADLGEIRNTDSDGAYAYRFAHGRVGEMTVQIEGPRRRFNLVPSDA